jgi:hypothetical protein
MPKKKLTKAQVKRKLKAMKNANYDLFLDKFGHADSNVPFSTTKMIELDKAIVGAQRRIK